MAQAETSNIGTFITNID